MDYRVLSLKVKNHPGTMSHIVGLFARRDFNLEGIMCGSIGDGEFSKIYLLVKNDDRFEQIIKQLSKLYDILDINICEDYDIDVFKNIPEIMERKSEEFKFLEKRLNNS